MVERPGLWGQTELDSNPASGMLRLLPGAAVVHSSQDMVPVKHDHGLDAPSPRAHISSVLGLGAVGVRVGVFLDPSQHHRHCLPGVTRPLVFGVSKPLCVGKSWLPTFLPILSPSGGKVPQLA